MDLKLSLKWHKESYNTVSQCKQKLSHSAQGSQLNIFLTPWQEITSSEVTTSSHKIPLPPPLASKPTTLQMSSNKI